MCHHQQHAYFLVLGAVLSESIGLPGTTVLPAWLSGSRFLCRYSALSTVPSERLPEQTTAPTCLYFLVCSCLLASMPHTPFLSPPEPPVSPNGEFFTALFHSPCCPFTKPEPFKPPELLYSSTRLSLSCPIYSRDTPTTTLRGGPTLHCHSFFHSVCGSLCSDTGPAPLHCRQPGT